MRQQRGFTLIDPRLRGDDKRIQGFTLIELLVVIAVIAILSVVVVLSLNPAEMLRQSRDNNRLSDMDTLTHALGLYQTDQGIVGGLGSLGSVNTIYVSFPDPNATTIAGSNCSSLGFPILPAGYTYHCAGPNYYRTTNGNGWIPLNFSSLTTGSPLGQLPVDPQNTSSSRLYYTYATNGTQFEITSVMESAKYKLGGSSDVISTDGGTLASVYEKGSKLGLEPLDYGDPALVGYWTFDEGTGSIVYDWSGNNASGTWQGTLGNQWVGGKIGNGAGNFNGTNNSVKVGTSTLLTPDVFTVTAWMKYASGTVAPILGWGGSASYPSLNLGWPSSPMRPLIYMNASDYRYFSESNPNNPYDQNWHFASFVVTGNSQDDILNSLLYIDGIQQAIISATHSQNPATKGNVILGQTGGYFNGFIDDVRIYNRVLSASEIQAIYTRGK